MKFLIFSAILVLSSCFSSSSSYIKTFGDTSKYSNKLIQYEYETSTRIVVHCNDGLAYYASGFIISPTQAITAHHATTCASGVNLVGLMTQDEEIKLMKIVSGDEEADVALLELTEGEKFKTWAEVDWESKVEIGEEVCSVGGSGYLPAEKYRKCGKVQHLSEDNHTFAIGYRGVRGNSGGPIFNKYGKVVGLISRATDPSNGGVELIVLGTKASFWKEKLKEL